LRFQHPTFLANYAAMQQTPAILLKPEATPETSTDAQIDGQNTQTQSTQTQITQTKTPATSEVEALIQPIELGGREGPEPTRFGDWEKAGRCIDF